MPLHDWTDERGWESVHPFWTAYLVEWLRPRLPEGYKAFLDGVPALTVAAIRIDLEETYQRATKMAYLD